MKMYLAITNLLRDNWFIRFGPRKAASHLQFKEICRHSAGNGQRQLRETGSSHITVTDITLFTIGLSTKSRNQSIGTDHQPTEEDKFALCTYILVSRLKYWRVSLYARYHHSNLTTNRPERETFPLHYRHECNLNINSLLINSKSAFKVVLPSLCNWSFNLSHIAVSKISLRSVNRHLHDHTVRETETVTLFRTTGHYAKPFSVSACPDKTFRTCSERLWQLKVENMWTGACNVILCFKKFCQHLFQRLVVLCVFF